MAIDALYQNHRYYPIHLMTAAVASMASCIKTCSRINSMSLINTEIKPFKATAYHNGKFVPVTHETLKGKWSVLVFYPADFTFVCPTELGDLADNYARIQEAGRRNLRRIHRHAFRPQGVARHLRHDREGAIPAGRRSDRDSSRVISRSDRRRRSRAARYLRHRPRGSDQDHGSARQRHRTRRQGTAAQSESRAIRRRRIRAKFARRNGLRAPRPCRRPWIWSARSENAGSCSTAA